MPEKLEGAKVTTKNEVRERIGKPNVGLAAYHASILEEEKKKIRANASDMEVKTGVSSEELAQLQKDKRLVGYEPATKVALVLKSEFIDKKNKAKGK